MMHQLVLHVSRITRQFYFMRKIMKSMIECNNHLIGNGLNGSDLKAILAKRSIHVWASCPYPLLEELPPIPDIIKSYQFMKGIVTVSHANHAIRMQMVIQNLAIGIIFDTHFRVLWMIHQLWRT
jgi:hypothetical protein